MTGNIAKAFALLERAYAIGQAEDNRFMMTHSLIEMAEASLNIEQWDDMRRYLEQVEQPAHELNNPELFGYFYYLQCMLALYEEDYAALKTHYAHYLRYASPYNLNHAHSFMFIFTRFALLQAQNNDLQSAAQILGGLDAYKHESSNRIYPKLVRKWHEQIIAAIDDDESADALHALMQADEQLSIEATLALIQNLFDDLSLQWIC